jgi:hypothetical protein
MRIKSLKCTEEAFTKQLIDLANTLGWKVAHFRPARTEKGWRTPCQGQAKGFPDLVLVGHGRIIFAELKSETGQFSFDQACWRDCLITAGATFYVWRPSDWDAIIKILGEPAGFPVDGDLKDA